MTLQGVCSAVGVLVGVFVFVFVGLGLGVPVFVAVAVFVGVDVLVTVGVGVGPVIENTESEMSKKILPIASIFTRPVVVPVFGIVTVSVPSFAVFAARTIGNVTPLSNESEILTFATLTGAAVVLATSHVIVCDEPPAHETLVLGAVTLNGPAVLVTFTTVSATTTFVCPIFTPGT